MEPDHGARWLMNHATNEPGHPGRVTPIRAWPKLPWSACPTTDWGQEVQAYVELKPGMRATDE